MNRGESEFRERQQIRMASIEALLLFTLLLYSAAFAIHMGGQLFRDPGNPSANIWSMDSTDDLNWLPTFRTWFIDNILVVQKLVGLSLMLRGLSLLIYASEVLEVL